MRKIIVLLLIIIALLALGGVAYFIWSTLGTDPTPQPSAPVPVLGGNGTTTPAGKLFRLGSSELSAYSNATNTLMGITKEGRVVRIEGSKETLVSESTIANLASASFSKNGERALVKFGSSESPLWSVFDTRANVWTPLSTIQIESATWAPGGNDLAYLERVNDKHNLGIMKLTFPAASSTKTQSAVNRETLVSLSLTDQVLSWPTSNEIIIADKPSQMAPGNTLLYNIKGKTFSLLAYNEAGTSFLWAPDGSRALKLYFQKGNHLMLVDPSGKHLQELAFVTMPEKCVFAGNLLYCAVPQEPWGRNVVLPDDYLKQNVFSMDDLYRINLDTGETDLFYRADTLLDATAFTAQADSLYFINRIDGHLYQLTY